MNSGTKKYNSFSSSQNNTNKNAFENQHQLKSEYETNTTSQCQTFTSMHRNKLNNYLVH